MRRTAVGAPAEPPGREGIIRVAEAERPRGRLEGRRPLVARPRGRPEGRRPVVACPRPPGLRGDLLVGQPSRGRVVETRPRFPL